MTAIFVLLAAQYGLGISKNSSVEEEGRVFRLHGVPDFPPQDQYLDLTDPAPPESVKLQF